MMIILLIGDHRFLFTSPSQYILRSSHSSLITAFSYALLLDTLKFRLYVPVHTHASSALLT